MKRNTIDIITLGCSKNLVDSEKLMRQLVANGYKVTHDAERPQGEIAVINTCGFIGDAKEESINMILEFCQAKEEGRLKKLFVMGCLSERYLEELKAEIPQVDKFYGKFNWKQLLADLGKAYDDAHAVERTLTTPRHYAYLKISEGCDRKCAYCAIPIITGRHESRPMEEILDEVRMLVAEGVKEFQVIAQELTYYGVDLYHEQKLPELIERIAQIPGVEWIRLHYAYPAHFPEGLFRVMREYPNVCKYMDIALQHISDNVLSRMRRHVTKEETYALIRKFRAEVPGIHLRTTLMVGFPGETDEDFEELKQFVKEAKFDRMGAFAYSEEEGTFAAQEYADDVPHEVKQARLDKLMAIQQRISAELSERKIGQTFRVIIDRVEGDYYIGRTEFDSPEVDPEVLIAAADGKLQIGEFYHVEVTSADDFDLYGTVIS
jgi:ribosomal protein S12 methylthiotransferase